MVDRSLDETTTTAVFSFSFSSRLGESRVDDDDDDDAAGTDSEIVSVELTTASTRRRLFVSIVVVIRIFSKPPFDDDV